MAEFIAAMSMAPSVTTAVSANVITPSEITAASQPPNPGVRRVSRRC